MSLTDALADYQSRQGSKKPAVAPWSRPENYQRGRVLLSIDQTLTKAGWVILWVDLGGLVQVVDRGMIRPKSERTSFMETFDKARQLSEGVTALFRTEWPVRLGGFVFEMPAVTGYRIESSLMAANECVRVAESFAMPYRIMSAQHARTVMCGPGKGNDKGAMQQAMKPFCVGSRWNEDQRDALGNGLVQLHELDEMGEAAWTEPMTRYPKSAGSSA